MHKSIRAKLFLTLLLTALLVVAGMYYFMRISFERGFTSFVESRQKKHLDTLLTSLTDYYDDHQEWQTLAHNKQKWVDMVWQMNDHHHPQSQPPWIDEALASVGNVWPPKPPENYALPPPKDSEQGSPEKVAHESPITVNQQPIGAFASPPIGLPPPTPGGDKFKPRFIPLEMRVMLLNTNKSLIYGRAELAGQLALTPIRHGGQTIGYLGVLPGQPLKQLADIQFMEHQAHELVGIALSMILLSAGLALLIAYILGKPLKRVIAASQALAVGRYDTRLNIDSNDELGQLARDFNALAAALEQAEQTRQRWVADISHELRTPLAVLRGELEALQDGVRPLNKSAVDSLYGDVMRLSRLAEDLYQLALSDQGALSYRKIQLDPTEVLADDLASLAAEYQRRAISVKVANLINKPILVYADPDRLSQLFRNLLNNTLHYTDSGGQLQISISRHKDQLLMDFADSEPGIPETALPKLFDRFYRLDTSRNRSLGGAGLGLAICHNIVTAHNGSIKASQSALGGLNIHITLPVLL